MIPKCTVEVVRHWNDLYTYFRPSFVFTSYALTLYLDLLLPLHFHQENVPSLCRPLKTFRLYLSYPSRPKSLNSAPLLFSVSETFFSSCFVRSLRSYLTPRKKKITTCRPSAFLLISIILFWASCKRK